MVAVVAVVLIPNTFQACYQSQWPMTSGRAGPQRLRVTPKLPFISGVYFYISIVLSLTFLRLTIFHYIA